MQFRSPFYLTIQQTAEGLWQSVMRTRAYGHDELWATGAFDYSSRDEAEREARLWARHEGYRYLPPASGPVRRPVALRPLGPTQPFISFDAGSCRL